MYTVEYTLLLLAGKHMKSSFENLPVYQTYSKISSLRRSQLPAVPGDVGPIPRLRSRTIERSMFRAGEKKRSS